MASSYDRKADKPVTQVEVLSAFSQFTLRTLRRSVCSKETA